MKPTPLSRTVATTAKERGGVTLHALLTRLIWFCVLPLVLLATFLAVNHVRTLQAELDEEAEHQARNFATAVDRAISAQMSALQVLAASPLLDDPLRLEEFYNEARAFRESFGSHVILADLSMQMLLYTHEPFGAVLPKLLRPKGHAAAPAALETGKPQVGDLFVGEIARQPVVAVVVPVIRDGHTKALLMSIVQARQFQRRLDEVSLPEGWSLTLLDGKDEVIASRPGSETEGHREVETSRRVVTKSAVSNWSVMLEVPRSILEAPINAAIAALVAAILAATLVSLLGGWLTGNRLARSVAALAEAPWKQTSGPVVQEIEAVRRKLIDTAAAQEEAEQGLLESFKREQFLGHIIRNASVAFGVGYPDGTIGICNKAFQDLTGYNENELTTLKWDTSLTAPEWSEYEAAQLDKLSQTKEPVRYEKEYVHKSGRRIPVELVVHPLFDDDGRVSHYFAFVTDITQRKQSEQRIEHLNRVLRSIREVNQLIVHEKNAHNLIEKTCRLLVDNQGYENALIIVTDEDDVPVSFAEAGAAGGFQPLAEKLKRGELPPCCEEARSLHGVYLIEDRAKACGQCALENLAIQGHSMCIRLRHEERTYGYLAAAVTHSHVSDREELTLFEELAGDIAFALRNMELTEQANRSAESLRRSEEKFRSLVETISEVIYEIDRDGMISYVSPVVRNVLGYEAEELIGKAFLGFVYPDDRELALNGFQRLMQGAEQPTECRVLGKSGAMKWVRTLAKASIKEGRFEGARGTVTDITERKRAEEALQKRVIALTQPLDDPAAIQLSDLFDIAELQNIQNAFADATGVSSIITAPDGTPITQPSNFRRLCSEIVRHTEAGLLKCFASDSMVGRYNPSGPTVRKCLSAGLYTAGASVSVGGKHLANWVVGQVREEVLDEERMLEFAREIGADPEDFAKAFADVPVMSGEQFEKVSRALFTFANELSLKAYQNVQQARFIAERQKAEAMRTRLVTAIEQAVEGVLITNETGTIQYVNPAVETMTGFSRNELLGKTPQILKSGEHDQEFYRNLWETIRRGEVWAGQFVNKRKDGRLYHEDATISPVRDPAGNIVNFVAVKRDITEHMELSRQLQQAQKMEAVGTLAGGIAHDFNNLLQAVLGYSELVIDDEDLPDQFRDDLEKIIQAGRNGADLVKRLLTFSRKTETKPLNLDLNQRIRQTRKFLERTIPKMIDIDLVLAPNLDAVNADPTQIDQVIMNLAVNARDAMPEGGRLVIETANVELDHEYAKSHLVAKSGRYVLLQVSDTGSGIEREMLEHIFEPFFTTKGPGEGTGLGLAIIYGIVRQNQGIINCYSEVGHGTTFKIYLPSVVSEPESYQSVVASPPEGGTETILLADDDELVRSLGERILKNAGYTVLTARNGKEALEIFRKERDRIGLVILDLIMPEMGGKKCFEEIRQLCPEAKVLISSGYTDANAFDKAEGSGATGFIDKPYQMSQMLRTVREVLDEV